MVRGTIEGYIGDKPAGENGFGYDPIFYVPDLDCSTAELSPEDKMQEAIVETHCGRCGKN